MPKLSLWHSCLFCYRSPSPTAPVSRIQLRAGILAMMTRAKALSPRGNVFLDRHVWIAKTNKLYDFTLFSEHRRFLRRSGRAFGFVITRELFSTIFHNYSFGNAYHPSGMVILLADFTLRPEASRTQTLALTLSASLTGCPLGT